LFQNAIVKLLLIYFYLKFKKYSFYLKDEFRLNIKLSRLFLTRYRLAYPRFCIKNLLTTAFIKYLTADSLSTFLVTLYLVLEGKTLV
jgi:hypothetical protein